MATGQQLRDLDRWIDGEIDDESAEGRRVREMVADLLYRSDTAILLRLANIIQPHPWNTTRIVFKRKRGNRSKQIDHRLVAAVVWQRIKAGDQREAAYQHAVDILKVSLRSAKTALAEWEEHFERHPEFSRIE